MNIDHEEWLGLSQLCQHNFEHYRMAKASSIMQISQLGSSFNRETWRLKPIFFPQPIYSHATLHPRCVSPHS